MRKPVLYTQNEHFLEYLRLIESDISAVSFALLPEIAEPEYLVGTPLFEIVRHLHDLSGVEYTWADQTINSGSVHDMLTKLKTYGMAQKGIDVEYEVQDELERTHEGIAPTWILTETGEYYQPFVRKFFNVLGGIKAPKTAEKLLKSDRYCISSLFYQPRGARVDPGIMRSEILMQIVNSNGKSILLEDLENILESRGAQRRLFQRHLEHLSDIGLVNARYPQRDERVYQWVGGDTFISGEDYKFRFGISRMPAKFDFENAQKALAKRKESLFRKNDLAKLFSSNVERKMYDVLHYLSNANLIVEVPVKSLETISLTPQGLKIAKELNSAYNILSNQRDVSVISLNETGIGNVLCGYLDFRGKSN